ncbi:hypothetical protein DPMN_082708 [Dreissena polymorpha]|uniref:Uncharacterized protein n=1 Tax=Dreissena polymorpha TaxID=45954 RepID=A0A9D3Y9R2_DREPO|nr:hypothetical protein DPMN_082708 [Dreissena polymorpha]
MVTRFGVSNQVVSIVTVKRNRWRRPMWCRASRSSCGTSRRYRGARNYADIRFLVVVGGH